jgi:hypothetical protein
MELFGIPDFVKGWREASFEVKQLTILRILASSYAIAFSAVCGRDLAAGVVTVVAIGEGMLWGAAAAALAGSTIGLPMAIPSFLFDVMAKQQMMNAANAPQEKKK